MGKKSCRRLFIPDIGTELVLAKDWDFQLHYERRNQKFAEKHDAPTPAGLRRIGGTWWDADESIPFMVPAGRLLIVDRIYVRQGASSYSSVSFRCYVLPTEPGAKHKRKSLGRFWAKLADVNTIECEVL